MSRMKNEAETEAGPRVSPRTISWNLTSILIATRLSTIGGPNEVDVSPG
jgi:hypothetical protein